MTPCTESTPLCVKHKSDGSLVSGGAFASQNLFLIAKTPEAIYRNGKSCENNGKSEATSATFGFFCQKSGADGIHSVLVRQMMEFCPC